MIKKLEKKVFFTVFLLVALAQGVLSPVSALESEAKSSLSNFSRGEMLLPLFEDREMNFQLLRSLGADSAGGGTPGEILLGAKSIEGGDPASWSAAFLALGERLEQDGKARLERGHNVSAAESLLRAASYYRAAEYYGDPLLEETISWGMRCRETFLQSMALSPWKVEDLRIPLGDIFLPAYFLYPEDADGNVEEGRKTLLIQSGFDGTAEEMYFALGKAALQRGYAVILFEGPGQVGMRRFHPDSVFLPDTSPALKAVVDYALSRPEVDPSKIALYGASFGGYFALSGAVREKRLRGVIANSPILDAGEYFFAAMGPKFVAMFQSRDLTVEEIKELPQEELPPKYRFSLLNLCLRYGKPSVGATLEAMKEFRVPEDLLHSMEMPALGMVSEAEGAVPLNQAKRFADIAPKGSLHIFSREQGANIHCQLDNMPLSWGVALDWLDEQF